MKHGAWRYNKLGCRCQVCCAAKREAGMRSRSRLRAKRLALQDDHEDAVRAKAIRDLAFFKSALEPVLAADVNPMNVWWDAADLAGPAPDPLVAAFERLADALRERAAA